MFSQLVVVIGWRFGWRHDQSSSSAAGRPVGGGAGLAYVFVHLLPELASGGSELSDARGLIDYVPTPLVESLLFLVALGGVLVVFSLNVLMQQRKDAPPFAVWLQLFSFAAINYLYAYSLPSMITTGIGYGVLFTVALSAHVLLTDRYAAEQPSAALPTTQPLAWKFCPRFWASARNLSCIRWMSSRWPWQRLSWGEDC